MSGDDCLKWITENVIDARTKAAPALEPWQEAIVRDVAEGRRARLLTPDEIHVAARRGHKRAWVAAALATAALEAEDAA